MTKDEIKKSLKLYRKIKMERDHLQKKIIEIRQTADGLKSTRWNSMPGSGEVSDPVFVAVQKYDELIGKYQKAEANAAKALFIVESMISGLKDPTERNLMRYKYIDGLTWEEVCVAIHYGWSRTHELHSSILDQLAEAYSIVQTHDV